MKAARAPQDRPDHKAQPVRKAQRERKGLRARQDPLVRKGAPASKDLRAHRA